MLDRGDDGDAIGARPAGPWDLSGVVEALESTTAAAIQPSSLSVSLREAEWR